MVAQFLYSAEEMALKDLSAPPDPVILDEAFRMIYADEKQDFRKLRKTDLGQMMAELTTRVSNRMKSDVVKEIMIEDFNYVSKDEVRK